MSPDDELELLTLGFRRYLAPGSYATTLWCCEQCGALVGDLARHHEFHREER